MKDFVHFHLPEGIRDDYNTELLIVSHQFKDASFKNPDSLERTYCIENLLDKNHCCSVCQGILQITDNDKFVSNICHHVKEDAFEFESFKFNVHAPLSTNFRYCRLSQIVPCYSL